MDELIGRTFGKLTIISFDNYVSYKGGTREAKYFCQCECGNKKSISIRGLLRNITISCGCYRRKPIINKAWKHGMKFTKEYWTWQSMKDRCYNKKSTAYKYYGERGITVCDRWRHSFKNFFEDMGKKPTPKHSIDRVDNNGNYEPSNCRWATQYQQVHNQRPKKSSIFISHNGIIKNAKDWAIHFNISYTVFWGRIKRGVSFEEAILPYDRRNKSKVCHIKSFSKSLAKS